MRIKLFNEKFFSVKEVSSMLRIDEKTVRALFAKEKLKGQKVGNFIRISEKSLKEHLGIDTVPEITEPYYACKIGFIVEDVSYAVLHGKKYDLTSDQMLYDAVLPESEIEEIKKVRKGEHESITITLHKSQCADATRLMSLLALSFLDTSVLIKLPLDESPKLVGEIGQDWNISSDKTSVSIVTPQKSINKRA